MDGNLQLKRQTDNGWEVIEAQMPVVISVTNDEHNLPRIPKVRDVMMSFRLPLTQWHLEDLDLAADEARAGNNYYEVIELAIPRRETQCEFVTGDTLDERVETLARRIVEVTSAL
jgi:electron transfer flavoprotein beta subunit